MKFLQFSSVIDKLKFQRLINFNLLVELELLKEAYEKQRCKTMETFRFLSVSYSESLVNSKVNSLKERDGHILASNSSNPPAHLVGATGQWCLGSFISWRLDRAPFGRAFSAVTTLWLVLP